MLKKGSGIAKGLMSAVTRNASGRQLSTLSQFISHNLMGSQVSAKKITEFKGSSSLLTRALTTSVVTSSNEISKPVTYVSPYEVAKPLDHIIIHNRSKNAANYAIRKLKDAWPNLKIIHVVQGERDPIPGADLCVRINDWSSMSHFKTQFDKMAAGNPALRASMRENKVGFYCVWSPAAESASFASAAQQSGFHWIGASPDKMQGLDKIEYKNLCRAKGLPTADFIEVKAPADTSDKEAALRIMATELVENYHQTPELAGKPVFAKHQDGGGGRGSKKITEMTFENALETLRKIINDTGGNLNGVYVEQALDLDGALMYQIEIEGDASQLAHGARLVWFNKENQKVLEVGFTDESILEILPKEVYDACRLASQTIFNESGYDSRGTNEILIVKNAQGKWLIKMLELNKRIQVENEAIAELVHDSFGRTRNVAAEQVMRSLGYPAPLNTDFETHGAPIVAHVRLLSCQITATGSQYESGLEIDGAVYPQGADVQYVKGPVHLDADPQLGRALIKADNLEALSNKLLDFSQTFQFYGPKTETSTYLGFMRQLASSPLFRQGKLGCNQTFNVLANPPVEQGHVQKIVAALSHTVTPLVSNGYRTKDGVKDQPYPTRNQMNEFVRFMEALEFETAPETPFSKFLKHHNFKTYISELKDLLANHGGGTVSVIRDVQQASADQESALIQKASAKIAEIHLVASGIGVGFEVGGAQYQAGLMRRFDWMEVLISGLLSNIPSHSLTRSKWLNGLSAKSPEQQAFIFKTIADIIAKHYGLESSSLLSDSFLPWFPYNFHAGNHPEQDVTTRLMLQANLGVMPNWAWDPRYTEEQFKGWVTRQINLFEEEGRPLSQIRIKNPGQGAAWNEDVIFKMVQTIRGMFKARGLEEPVIFIHNHDFNGKASDIAAKAILLCQAAGYPLLVVDTAPLGCMSHNANTTVSKSLIMSPEKRDHLAIHNEGMHLLLDLTTRFNNSNLTKKTQNPDSKMAGGTNSSDRIDAIKMGIHPRDMEKAIRLGYDLLGLGTPVTPFSEWIKQVGFALWKNENVQPKTLQGASDYINQGGQLTIATPILEGLRDWKTLLVRPKIVETLLANHGLSLEAKAGLSLTQTPLDIEAERAKLQKTLPNTNVGSRELSTWFGFDKIGLDYLISRDKHEMDEQPKDMTVMMECPEFVYSEKSQAGDKFKLYGEIITINHIERNLATGRVDVSYLFQGNLIRMHGKDVRIINPVAESSVKLAKGKMELGASIPGVFTGFFVAAGQTVKKGQQLATIEAMKMENSLQAQQDGTIDSLSELEKGASVVQGELLLTFK